MQKHPVPDLSGKVCVITGANTGIGEVAARELVAAGAEVFLACRSAERGKAAAERIAAATGKEAPALLPLDLGSFESVRACADLFLGMNKPLHMLINNAGLAGFQGQTTEGFEMAFGVNHLGHFLLTLLLEDKIVESAKDGDPARIVTVASRAHRKATGIDWAAAQQRTKTTSGYPEYCVSKLANILFSAKLAERLKDKNVLCYSLHPGVVASDVWRRVPGPFRFIMKLFMITNEEGAMTTLHCATSPECATQTGLYYDKCAPVKPNGLGTDMALAEELWKRSIEWTGLSS
ncbi:MAG: SDR family NAD(P)-dependent oxidoreductase [Polyangiales bacterium]